MSRPRIRLALETPVFSLAFFLVLLAASDDIVGFTQGGYAVDLRSIYVVIELLLGVLIMVRWQVNKTMPGPFVLGLVVLLGVDVVTSPYSNYPVSWLLGMSHSLKVVTVEAAISEAERNTLIGLAMVLLILLMTFSRSEKP